MKTTKRTLLAAIVVCLSFFIAGPVRAVIETFDNYPEHTNTTSAPGEAAWFWIYGDDPVNTEIVATWATEPPEEVGGSATSAGIATNGVETYAFGTASGELPPAGREEAFFNVGHHDQGITSGVISDYLGPDGKELHGGWMDVRALLTGFTGQIALGFFSNRYVDGGGWDEFEGPVFDVTDSFAWYHGDLNDFLSDYDGARYGDLPGVKVLGLMIDVFANTDDPIITGEFQVDEIVLVPEPATLGLLLMGGLALLRLRRRRTG